MSVQERAEPLVNSTFCPGLGVEDVDVFEINEAFASQVTCVLLPGE